MLHDSHVSSDNGEVLWYPEPYFKSGTVNGTFRHRDCKRVGKFDGGVCSACKSIPKIDSFRLKLQRRCGKDENSSVDKTNFAYRSKDELLSTLSDKCDQIEFYKSQIFLLSSKLARVKQRAHTLKERLKEHCRRGDVKAIGYNIAKAYEGGLLKEKSGLLDILSTVSQNLTKKAKGKRYSATTKDFYEVLLTIGGPRLCQFVAHNLDGPHVHSAMVWRKKNIINYELGKHKENILAITSLYKKVKESLHLETTSVPYIKAEDETAIIARPEYKADSDEIWGFCGMKGKDHICKENFVVNVGDDEGAYERLLDAFVNCQVASHSRVIMINPLHRNFPKVVLFLQANCNRFTHNEVLHQWLLLDSLCQNILDPVLGPGIGHASDGDSRRRKLMLNQATATTNTYQPISHEDGFIMSARVEVTAEKKKVLRDLYDQDCIHNDKKILNPLDHPTRILKLGRYSAHINHLRLVMNIFQPAVHNMRADDIARKDRQKWEVVQRLKFLSVQKCLLDICNGRNGAEKDVSVLGTWAFLYVAWHYTEIFFSLHASLRDRVKYAAFVVTFYSLWRNWIIVTDGLVLKERFLTRECFQDVLLSCHFAVILISFFRDEHSDIECPLDLTGTDCCERYFSENGSFVQNKHNYTFLDMHTNLGHMNRIQEIRAVNNDIKFPKRNHNNDFIWDKQFPQERRSKECDLKDYPSPQEVIKAWREGVDMAKNLSRRLGMCPDADVDGYDGDDHDSDASDDKKEWFDKPMEFIDFKESLKGMVTEEELEELRQQHAEESESTACDLSGENIDTCLDDNIGTNGDVRHIVNPLLDQLNCDENQTTNTRKTKPTILVPGVGERYKSTVVAELRNNPSLSTDRLRRVRNASVNAKDACGISESQLNSVSLFDDCAFIERKNSGDTFVLGRVQRMRKKGKRGFVEYIKPVSLDDRPKDVEVIFSKYKLAQERYFDHTEEMDKKPLSSVICKVSLSLNCAKDMYELCKDDDETIQNFVRSLQRARPQPATASNQVTNSNMDDDGRRVESVMTTRGRLSRRVSYLY